MATFLAGLPIHWAVPFQHQAAITIPMAICKAGRSRPRQFLWLPTVIQLPDGLTYQFTYAQNDYGEPTSVILPTGAQISWTWGNVDSSGPKVISRTVTIGGQSFIWHYSYGYSGNHSLWVNTITDPMGNETDYTCTYLHVDPHGSDVGGDPGCTPVKVHR